MKLYEVPRNTTIRLKSKENGPPDSINPKMEDTYYFKHIDGMYSHCLDSKGNNVYLPAWSEVELIP